MSDAEAPPAAIDPRLLEILICPVSRGPLRLNAATNELFSLSARLAYPVRDGIPILLEDEARDLRDDET